MPRKREPARETKHRLLLELGRGGMGTVYLAVTYGPAGFCKLKVVKQLRYELAEDATFLDMFMDEARLSARLNHPNIVQTNEVGFDGTNYFIEMEYLEGQSFETFLRAGSKQPGACPLPLALYVLAQCCAGLHYAHELRDRDGVPMNIVHRDVSPHNVFVTYAGAVKVLDFGIAKAADSSSETRTGVVKGKAAYMAPEQATRGEVDRRTDVFAVGVMLWQLVAGRRLYEGLSEGEIFSRLQRGDVGAELDAGVPEGLRTIVARALEPDREKRFPTAEALQIALEDHLAKAGASVGSRQLAGTMSELFAERRKAVSAEIDRLMLEEPAAGAAIPRLDATIAGSPNAKHRTWRTPTTSNPPLGGTPPDASTRPGRRWLGIAATLGLVAALGATALLVRGPFAQAPAAATLSARSATSGKPTTSCARSVDCRAGGNAVCRDGSCVPLEAASCHVLAERGQVEDDSAVIVGAMFPQTGPSAEAYGLASMQTVDLVRRDFQQMSGGLTPSRPGMATRPLVVLACDDSNDAQQVAEHLAKEVRVPAVIGFRSSQEAMDLATNVFLPAHVLVVAALNQSSPLTAVPGAAGPPRLVWRTTFDTRAEARPMSHILSDVLEPQLHGAGIGEVRVALVRPDGALGVTLSDALVSSLRFNGSSTPQNSGRYKELVYGGSNENAAPKDTDAVVRTLVDFAPQVVFFVGNETDADAIILPTEERWHAAESPRPRYVFNSPIVGDAIRGHLSQGLRMRLYGIGVPSNTDANLKYTLHFNEVFATHMNPRGAFGSVYDAGYIVAYAAYAAELPLTGESLARAMGLLVPPGTAIEVGPTHIFEAFGVLRTGNHVDVVGAATALDFDSSGETATDFVVMCLDSKGDNQQSGLVYRRAKDAIDGAWKCE